MLNYLGIGSGLGISTRLVLSCLLALAVGCASKQQTRVHSGVTDTEKKIVQLEESSVDAPIEIKVAPVQIKPSPIEKSTQESDDATPSRPNGDLFASSGKSSSLPKIPKTTPVPALAKPDTLQGLPFTLSDIFFDYDQYTLHQDDVSVLETNAKVLLGRYPKKKILIQGHCDERGTEEYNLALGVRRAQAVKDYLVDLGVPPERLQVLSYGKEKPFCTQHSRNCWKHNRRGHFVFQ